MTAPGMEPMPPNTAATKAFRPGMAPAVGVMVYAADIAADFWAIAGSLVLSVLIALAFCGVLMQKMIARQARREEKP